MRRPLDGEDDDEEDQRGGLVPERGLLGAGGAAGRRAEPRGERVGLVVGQDGAAGGGGEAVERVVRRGQLDPLGGRARHDLQRRLRDGRGTPGGDEVQRLGEPGDVEADGVRADRQRGGGPLERPGPAGDRPQRHHGDRLGGRGAGGRVGLEDAGGDQQVGADPGDPLGDPRPEPRRSPSATRGRAGPNRTRALPAASLPDAAQRTTWPQNRWW